MRTVCFPWFGAHATDPGKPQHGSARTRAWEVESIAQDPQADRSPTTRRLDDEGDQDTLQCQCARLDVRPMPGLKQLQGSRLL
jgi:D-hexose-6-phosphate mutarotase